jgi:hypothetical protein
MRIDTKRLFARSVGYAGQIYERIDNKMILHQKEKCEKGLAAIGSAEAGNMVKLKSVPRKAGLA